MVNQITIEEFRKRLKSIVNKSFNSIDDIIRVLKKGISNKILLANATIDDEVSDDILFGEFYISDDSYLEITLYVDKKNNKILINDFDLN